MNLKEIQDLIKFVAKSGIGKVEIEQEDFKITIQAAKKEKAEKQVIVQPAATAAMPAPTPQVTTPAATPQQVAESKKEESTDDAKYITIKSPMIGTFYRSPSPDKPPFVSVGDTIKEGDTICIIEAMKLFNEIEAEVSGKIVKVLVDDATPVEYDQPLFLVDPS